MKYFAGIILLLTFWLTLSVAHIAGSMPPPQRVIDCNKTQPKIAAKSSVDSKTYLVDICSVVDSASGEDFRSEVK